MAVTIIHAGVPGRVRLLVERLRRNVDAKRIIENAAANRSGILLISSSLTTGSVVIQYGPDLDADKICAFIESVASHIESAENKRDFRFVGIRHKRELAKSNSRPYATEVWHTRSVTDVLKILQSHEGD